MMEIQNNIKYNRTIYDFYAKFNLKFNVQN
jgi:hypothetical protein